MSVKERLDGCRGDLIVKSNDLIEASYRLNLNEQRLILFMMSKIKKEDTQFRTCRISVKEFVETYDLNLKNTYKEIKQTTKSLTEKSMTIKDKNNPKNYIHISWLASAAYVNGILELEFSDKLSPYLLEIRDNFSKYMLGEFVKFSGVYTIRLYQMFKQYLNIGYRYYTLEEFRRILQLENKYPKYSNLKIKVINFALDEINRLSNIRVELVEKKEGKKVVGVGFKIKSAIIESVGEVVDSEDEVKNTNNSIIEDYQIQVVKDMLKNIGELKTSDIKALLSASKGDINKIFTQYMNVLQSKSKIRNVVGFMIEGIRRGYDLINKNPNTTWNYTEDESEDIDFSELAEKTKKG